MPPNSRKKAPSPIPRNYGPTYLNPSGKKKMTIQVLMPALSPTMTEGKLARWLKKEGDEVKAGQVLAEIETDKATMEVEAVDEGKLGKILIPAGAENVKVNTPIAILLEEGESTDALKNAGAPKSAEKPKAKTPTAPKAEARAS